MNICPVGRVVPCCSMPRERERERDGQTDMTKLIIAFCNYAKRAYIRTQWRHVIALRLIWFLLPAIYQTLGLQLFLRTSEEEFPSLQRWVHSAFHNLYELCYVGQTSLLLTLCWDVHNFRQVISRILFLKNSY